MTTLSIANPADREALSREAYKIIAANEPAKTEAETKAARKKKNADALTRENVKRAIYAAYGSEPVDLASIEHRVPCGEDTSTVADNVEFVLSEDGVSALSDNAQEVDESALLPQERKLEASKRAAALKAQAKIERNQLSAHRLAD
jgi:hypothetical protein